MATTTPTAVRHAIGRRVRANLPTAELYEDAVRHGEGLIAADGPLVVRTGRHTGRSPEDKFIVDEPGSRDHIWWGAVNRPISEANYDRLRARLVAYCADRDLYAQDCYIGAHPGHRRSLRVYTETAWASLFARNLFRRPAPADLAAFAPNFTIICVPSFKADPATEGTRTETAILVHLRRMEVLIVGTEYAGEIKKSAFTVMNYLLPDEGVLPMHCAVNVGRRRRLGDLLRAVGHRQDDPVGRPERRLIGDDEHGWSDDGRVQLRGRLLRQDDPPLARCTSPTSSPRRGASARSSRTSTSTRARASSTSTTDRLTENTRGAYPLELHPATPTRRAWPASRATSSS